MLTRQDPGPQRASGTDILKRNERRSYLEGLYMISFFGLRQITESLMLALNARYKYVTTTTAGMLIFQVLY